MKLKRIVLSVVAICLFLALAPMSAKAEGVVGDASSTVIYPSDSGTCGTNVKWKVANGTLTIYGSGAMTEYASRTEIPWMDYREYTEKVVVQSGVTSIGSLAFWGHYNVESVSIASTVKTIGFRAFEYCTAMTSITIPSSVTSIQNCAFENCTGLVSVTIPSSVKTITNYAFSGCTALTHVSLPSTITEINYKAFLGCTALASIEIPSSVKTIGDSAFYDCDSLMSVTIPSSVTSIGSNAFSYCGTLCEVIFKGNSPTFGTNVFGTVTTKAYYPKNNSTWTSSVLQNYGGTISWYSYGNIGVDATLAYTSTTYTGSAQKPAVTVSNMVEGVDYTVSYSNNVNAGTATVTITPLGLNTGTIIKTFTINPIESSKLTVTLPYTRFAYSAGSVKTPKVTVKKASGKTVAASNYTVTYASGRKNVGKYWVKVTFSGNYSGTVTKYFSIVPNPSSVKSLTKASKAFTVKWRKETTQTTGYQIQYSTSKTFSNNVSSKYITSNKTTSKKITGLKAKKKYYVRIRTYKTVSGTKYYSGWSPVKNVTTK